MIDSKGETPEAPPSFLGYVITIGQLKGNLGGEKKNSARRLATTVSLSEPRRG